MNTTTEVSMPFVFTDSAASKVKSLIDEEGNPDLKLRDFVTGGGCSGFQYGGPGHPNAGRKAGFPVRPGVCPNSRGRRGIR